MAKTGHPPTYNSPDEMAPLIDAYFDECDRIGEPYTVVDLALAVGFSSRQTLLDYAAKPEFADTIKRAKSRIEGQRCRDLVRVDTRNSNGIKFDLTNNFGYTERQEIDHTTKGEAIPFTRDNLTAEELALLRKLAYINADDSK
jgi:hypothetical protein